MKHLALALAILFLTALALPAAERIVLAPSTADVNVSVLQSNGMETVLRFEINAFEREPVDIAGQPHYRISCGREGTPLNAGEPELPRICRSIIVTDDGEMSVEVLASEYTDFPGHPVVPSKGDLLRTTDPAAVPYDFGPVYAGTKPYPAELAAVRAPYILRDYRGTVVEVNAFQYLPASQTLRVYTSVTLRVHETGHAQANVLQRETPPAKVDPAFDQVYRRRFLNYGSGGHPLLYVPVLEDGEMLIITYDAFRDALQPLVSWKIQKGLRTTVVNVSTIGNNGTAIRNYIQNFFTSSGGSLAYVLLVGDAAQVATLTASGGSSDPTYAKVAGSDNYPDIFIGRFSAENLAHVGTQVERTVEYERDARADSTWYHRGTGIASNQGPGDDGEYDNQHMNNIRTDLLNYNYTLVDQIYDPSGTAAQVSAALNSGRGTVNYCGHGSVTSWSTTGFSNSHIANLTADNRLPFIHSVACVNGQFSGYTCFAEAWLRSMHNGEPIGAIAAYMSSINQSWNPPMDSQDEFIDLLRVESKQTFGGLCFNGSCHMIDVYGLGGVDMYNTWHVFGDPSVVVRTDTPVTMTVTHSGQVEESDTAYTVTVEALPGALCALSRNDTLYGAAYTNAGGIAAIPVVVTPTGENLVLTVTAMNKIAFIDTVAVGIALVPPTVIVQVAGEDIVLNWANTRAPQYAVYHSEAPEGPYTFWITTPDTVLVDTAAVLNGLQKYYVVTSALE